MFYGRDIRIIMPGHLPIMNMGRDCPTALDEQIFEEYGSEYLVEVRDHYMADKYNILGNDTQRSNAWQQLALDIHCR